MIEILGIGQGFEYLKLILASGKVINLDASYGEEEEEGETMLVRAVMGKDIDSVRLLLENGADPALKGLGRTALDWAKSLPGRQEIANLLSSYTND